MFTERNLTVAILFLCGFQLASLAALLFKFLRMPKQRGLAAWPNGCVIVTAGTSLSKPHESVASILGQEYPGRLEFIFVVSTPSSPFYEHLCQLASKAPNIKVVCSGCVPAHASEECLNQIFGVERAHPETEVLFFAGLGGCFPSTWARELAAALGETGVGVSASGQMPLPANTVHSSLALASAALAVKRSAACDIGAAAFAIRKSDYLAWRVKDLWDYGLAGVPSLWPVLRRNRLKIRWVPQAFAAVPATEDLCDLFAQSGRERFIQRVYSPFLWRAGFLDTVVRVYAFFWAMNLPFCWQVIAHHWTGPSLISWRLFGLVIGADVIESSAVLGALAFLAPYLNIRTREAAQAALAAPLLRFVQLVNFLGSLGAAGVFWSDFVYKIEGRARITVLPRPFPPTATNNSLIVAWIAEITSGAQEATRARLYREELWPGSGVKQEIKRRGITPYQWSDDLLALYRDTDAFLYEVVIWNRTKFKLNMRHWLMGHIGPAVGAPLNILCYGDGVGFDSAALDKLGHHITYFEVSSLSADFARRLFLETGAKVLMAGSDPLLEESCYDVIVCLDVLEHVPDPPALVARFARCLQPGGRLIVHAPFGIINSDVGTHLTSNRKYYGRVRELYSDHGLELIDGNWAWNPIVLEKGPCTDSHLAQLGRSLLAMRMIGALMRWGIFSALSSLLVECIARPIHWLGLRVLNISLFEGPGAKPFVINRLFSVRARP